MFASAGAVRGCLLALWLPLLTALLAWARAGGDVRMGVAITWIALMVLGFASELLLLRADLARSPRMPSTAEAAESAVALFGESYRPPTMDAQHAMRFGLDAGGLHGDDYGLGHHELSPQASFRRGGHGGGGGGGGGSTQLPRAASTSSILSGGGDAGFGFPGPGTDRARPSRQGKGLGQGLGSQLPSASSWRRDGAVGDEAARHPRLGGLAAGRRPSRTRLRGPQAHVQAAAGGSGHTNEGLSAAVL